MLPPRRGSARAAASLSSCSPCGCAQQHERATRSRRQIDVRKVAPSGCGEDGATASAGHVLVLAGRELGRAYFYEEMGRAHRDVEHPGVRGPRWAPAAPGWAGSLRGQSHACARWARHGERRRASSPCCSTTEGASLIETEILAVLDADSTELSDYGSVLRACCSRDCPQVRGS
ncbi:MAG: hypothetical protein RL385_833 [Pseudomonadota bacterium]|jgi:hypothetical protein